MSEFWEALNADETLWRVSHADGSTTLVISTCADSVAVGVAYTTQRAENCQLLEVGPSGSA
jgi:hypothetical protein